MVLYYYVLIYQQSKYAVKSLLIIIDKMEGGLFFVILTFVEHASFSLLFFLQSFTLFNTLLSFQ